MSQNQSNVPDLAEFEASTCTDSTRETGTGGMSIIYSANGKRLALNASIMNALSQPGSIQISYAGHVLALANFIGETNTDYKLKKSGKTGVLYNTQLIHEIVERYELDYENRTSLTFPVIGTEERDGEVIVFIQMTPRVQASETD
ncbi:hypothetical protein [Metaplanococcus flavidus]|uniref:Uncharacterized protein n=1 Tax=Metaplanococcus flavidus TaxID=569883 RepID=A0ABW3LDA3_9BACL